MKKLFAITLLLLFLPTLGFGQDMKVKWEDDDGREFSIKVLSGEFGWSMVPGDMIHYDRYRPDRVTRIGNLLIHYDLYRPDRVTRTSGQMR